MESTNPICKQINELLDAFHDGELRGDEQTLVESHLKECESCLVKIADIARVKGMLRNAPLEAVPAGFSARLDGVIDRQTKVVPFRRRTAWAAGAVAAVAVIAAGLHFLPGGGESGVPTVATNTGTPVAPLATNPNGIAANSNGAAQNVPTQIAALPTVTSAAPSVPVMSKDNSLTAATTQHHVEATARTTSEPATTTAVKPSVKPSKSPSTTDGGTQIASAPSQGASPINNHYDSAGSTSAMDVGSTAASEEIADLPVTTDSFNEAIGLSTDEDGLYDIKM